MRIALYAMNILLVLCQPRSLAVWQKLALLRNRTSQQVKKVISAVTRHFQGLMQQHLTKLAKLSRQTVQTLEVGTIEDLGFERLSRLLSVLGLGFDKLSLTALG
ncbi:Helix-turn-helix domain protein [Mycoavidus cysteinexigens]|uniref:Helix-turn-helix domain protein n=1 Tax=Mycoavidus cysteinexigens TaxID=1553431 RepID=A0A2Z6ETV7_9BURK|nr:Helix-turn-helix domain protein [Mycoavidus cysteinexigens]GLR01138.1 hypothetical protein GCM10007934_09500 [Mycoavidus cysteinexigens]